MTPNMSELQMSISLEPWIIFSLVYSHPDYFFTIQSIVFTCKKFY